MSYFKRAYKITIGSPYVFSPSVNSFERVRQLEQFFATAEENGIVISEHNISFRINHVATPNKEVSEITIYNLSDDDVSFLEQSRDKKPVIKFEAGYEGDIKLLFKGTIDAVTDDFSTATRKTKLTLGDGTVNLKEAVSFRTYPSGTPVTTIVQDLISDLGLPVGLFVPPVGVSPIPLAKTYHGPTRLLLERYGMYLNYRLSITDSSVNFVPNDAMYGEETAPFLSSSTGLIGTPAPITKSHGSTQASTEPKTGYKVTSLLDGSIKPETSVYIQSRELDQAFKVQKVVYVGELEGSSWYNEMEVIKVNKTIKRNVVSRI